MKTIMVILVAANIFIAGCKPQEKKVVPKEDEMTAEIRQAADQLNKQIDVLSADLKGTTTVLKTEMPGIVTKVQELIVELKQVGQEIEKSLNKIEPAPVEQK